MGLLFSERAARAVLYLQDSHSCLHFLKSHRQACQSSIVQDLFRVLFPPTIGLIKCALSCPTEGNTCSALNSSMFCPVFCRLAQVQDRTRPLCGTFCNLVFSSSEGSCHGGSKLGPFCPHEPWWSTDCLSHGECVAVGICSVALGRSRGLLASPLDFGPENLGSGQICVTSRRHLEPDL